MKNSYAKQFKTEKQKLSKKLKSDLDEEIEKSKKLEEELKRAKKQILKLSKAKMNTLQTNASSKYSSSKPSERKSKVKGTFYELKWL